MAVEVLSEIARDSIEDVAGLYQTHADTSSDTNAHELQRTHANVSQA